MTNEPKTVEIIAGEAVTPDTQVVVPEVDLFDEFQLVLEDNKKLIQERDNYKRIGLARKRGEVEPLIDKDEEIERLAEERAKELLLLKEQATNEAKQREIALKALKENRELRLALKNRAGVVTTVTGAGQGDKETPKEVFWTPEQLAHFKKRGIDPETVKKHYLNNRA